MRPDFRTLWHHRAARPFGAVVLALMLAISSYGLATARGQAVGLGGAVILCTGSGAQVVTVDQNGQPLRRLHLCPDMVLSMMAAPPAAPLVLIPPDGARAATHVTQPPRMGGRRALPPRSRGPPVRV